ncbi:MAG: hypothetical protein RIR77_447, partial [Planctomycetota bacterium]
LFVRLAPTGRTSNCRTSQFHTPLTEDPVLTAGARTRKARAHQGLEPVHLAAGAGEDRAALSGHPRKANAGQ